MNEYQRMLATIALTFSEGEGGSVQHIVNRHVAMAEEVVAKLLEAGFVVTLAASPVPGFPSFDDLPDGLGLL